MINFCPNLFKHIVWLPSKTHITQWTVLRNNINCNKHTDMVLLDAVIMFHAILNLWHVEEYYKIIQLTVLTLLSSQIFKVLSSEAETSKRLSLDQLTSLMPNLCPDIVFSNLPSYAPQILTSLSAAKRKQYIGIKHCNGLMPYIYEILIFVYMSVKVKINKGT